MFVGKSAAFYCWSLVDMQATYDYTIIFYCIHILSYNHILITVGNSIISLKCFMVERVAKGTAGLWTFQCFQCCLNPVSRQSVLLTGLVEDHTVSCGWIHSLISWCFFCHQGNTLPTHQQSHVSYMPIPVGAVAKITARSHEALAEAPCLDDSVEHAPCALQWPIISATWQHRLCRLGTMMDSAARSKSLSKSESKQYAYEMGGNSRSVNIGWNYAKVCQTL